MPNVALVGSGSNSEVAALPRYFCFAPMNGHRETQSSSPFGATSGSDAFLFDHLIGPDEQRRRHGNSDRASGVQVYGQFDPCWFLKW
jgi:hypothetical protein